jgi:hypothetical protein
LQPNHPAVYFYADSASLGLAFSAISTGRRVLLAAVQISITIGCPKKTLASSSDGAHHTIWAARRKRADHSYRARGKTLAADDCAETAASEKELST